MFPAPRENGSLEQPAISPDGTLTYTPAPNATGFAGHTVAATMVSGANIRQAMLGAAVGSGVIWTFGDTGLLIAAGTANGIGVICPSGFTGQIVDYNIDWDE